MQSDVPSRGLPSFTIRSNECLIHCRNPRKKEKSAGLVHNGPVGFHVGAQRNYATPVTEQVGQSAYLMFLLEHGSR